MEKDDKNATARMEQASVIITDPACSSTSTSDKKSIARTAVSEHPEDLSTSDAAKMPTEETLKVPSVKTHTGETFYLCTVCRMAFSTWRIWVEHILTHCEQHVAKCIVCNEEFPQKHDLKSHLLRHGSRNQHASTKENAKKRDKGKSKPVVHYQCSLCNEIFPRKKLLEAHASRHTERPYVCTVCGKAFKLHNHLKSHENIHSTRYQCTICGKLNSTNCHLEQHLLLHKDNKGHVCSVCGKTFRWKGDLKRHSWVHTEEKPFQCTVCNKGFTCKSNLNLHVRIHGHAQEPETRSFRNENSTAVQLIMEEHTSEVHDTHFADSGDDRSQIIVKTFKPKEQASSQQIFSEEKVMIQSDNTWPKQQEQELQPSLNVDTVEPNKSVVIDMTKRKGIVKGSNIKGSSNIMPSITTHTGKTFYICSLCDKAFQTRTTLRDHLFGHCQKNPSKCVMCNKVFSDCYLKVHLNAHMGKTVPKINRRKKETRESPLTHLCSQCGKSFESSRSLHIHNKQTHEVSFKCTLCKERFARKDLFAEHLCVHSGTEQCDLCGKAFATVKVLRQHLFLHKGEKENRCPLCDKSFLSRRSLRCHMNRHIGIENKQECNVCGKIFASGSHLRRHLQVHGDGYRCSLCNKILKFKEDLRRHTESYCEGRQFTCTACGKVFKREIQFTKHMEEHSKKQEPESTILGEDKANNKVTVPCGGQPTEIQYHFETENRSEVISSAGKESSSNTITEIWIPDATTNSTLQETQAPFTGDTTEKEATSSTIIYVINLVDKNQ